MGHKRTSSSPRPLSAFPPKADITRIAADARFVPIGVVSSFTVRQCPGFCAVPHRVLPDIAYLPPVTLSDRGGRSYCIGGNHAYGDVSLVRLVALVTGLSVAAVGLSVLLVGLADAQPQSGTPQSQSFSAQEAQEIATNAYMYAYPLVIMEMTLSGLHQRRRHQPVRQGPNEPVWQFTAFPTPLSRMSYGRTPTHSIRSFD